MTEQQFKLSDTFIFYINDKGFVAVDTKQQKYYQLNEECIDRIKTWALYPNSTVLDSQADHDLLKTGLLKDTSKTNPTQWKGDTLSWFFYHSTRNLSQTIPHLEKESFINHYLETSKKTIPYLQRHSQSNILKRITLPEPHIPDLEAKSLYATLKNRKTCRNFDKQPISLQQLSTLLYATFGYIHGKEWDEFNNNQMIQYGYRKSSPSATGLHVCEAYVAVIRVDGLKSGIYRYNPDEQILELVKLSCTDEDIQFYVCDQFWVEGISAGIFITIDLQLVWAKDPKVRAFPVAYLEAGHFSQALQLCATALELNTWLSGTFRDDIVSKDLGLDTHIVPVTFIGFGHGNGEAIPADFQKSRGT